MIGSKYIEINWKNWVQGMTTSNFTEDGGFSIGPGVTFGGTSNVNPLITQGILNFPALPVDKSTGLVGEILMSCEDGNVVGVKDRLVVSRVNSTTAKFYTLNGADVLSLVDTDSTRDYQQGKSDMAPFGTFAYGTSSTYIFEWNIAGGTVNQTFQDLTATYTNASVVPHPVLFFENNMFYGNGNKLLRQTTPGGAATTILTLDTSQVIVAFGIDPGSGKMLISTVTQINLSDTENTTAKVLYYDGFSNKPLKAVIVDEMITCFYVVGGTIFIAYGQNFGYWSGTGIQFLRRLNVALDFNQLVYKHKITNIGHILFIAEKNRILAFGEVMQGQGRCWWYALENTSGGLPVNLTVVFNLGDNKLGYSYDDAKFFTLNTRSKADIDTANALVFSRKYDFPRNVTFNNFVIDFEDEIPINVDIGNVYIFNDTISAPFIGTVRTNQAGILTWQVPYPTLQARSVQIRYIPARNLGIERITWFYNDKE
jgi:hypothetical protein